MRNALRFLLVVILAGLIVGWLTAIVAEDVSDEVVRTIHRRLHWMEIREKSEFQMRALEEKYQGIPFEKWDPADRVQYEGAKSTIKSCE